MILVLPFVWSVMTQQIAFGNNMLPQRLFTPEDLVDMDRLGNVVAVNDNSFFYTLASYDREKDLTTQAVHYQSGHQTKQVTFPKPGQMDTSLTLVGNNQILYVRDKLLFVQALDGPVREMANIEFPVDNFRYNKDYLYFTAEVYQNKTIAQTLAIDSSTEPSSGVVFDKLFIRHWDKWNNGKLSHIFRIFFDGLPFNLLHAEDLMFNSMEMSSPMEPFGGVSDYDVNGNTLIFVTKALHGKSEIAWSTETNIVYVDLQNRQNSVQVISTSNRAAKSSPDISPDGQKIAWLEMSKPQNEADQNHVFTCILDDCVGTTLRLDKKYQNHKTSVRWAYNSEDIYVMGEHNGKHYLALYEERVDQARFIIEDVSEIVYLSKQSILYIASSMQMSPQVFKYNIQEQQGTLVTYFNENTYKQVRMASYKHFCYEVDSLTQNVCGWYMPSPKVSFDERAPLLVLIHGGPESSWTDSHSYRWNPQVFAAQGYSVAMINPRGSTGYGQTFTDEIHQNWGSLPYNDILEGITYVQSNFLVTDEVYAAGASFGGYMINWINGQTDKFKCLVNHDGLFDTRSMYYSTEELYFPEVEFGGTPFRSGVNYEKYNPVNFVKNWKTPTMVIHGGLDFRVPLEQGISTFTALQRKGINSRLLYFPEENHWVLRRANSLKWHKEIFKWLNKCA